MFELLFAVVLVAGLGALFGGLKGARTAILLVGTLGVLSVAVIVDWGLYADNQKAELRDKEKTPDTLPADFDFSKEKVQGLPEGAIVVPPLIDPDAIPECTHDYADYNVEGFGKNFNDV